MSDHEGLAARAVYDHEVDEPHLGGRRRAVADWGVGEEIFDHMPRRRVRRNESSRRDHRPRERRGVVEGDPSRARRFEPASDEPRFERAADEPRFQPAVDGPRFERAADEPRFQPAADEPRFEPAADEPRFEPAATEPPIEPAPIAPIELAPEPPLDLAEPPPEGRRTVVIRGRGAEAQWTPRQRPPRTVGERIGPRPDRLAAWAVALGMLLILIAILTAHG